MDRLGLDQFLQIDAMIESVEAAEAVQELKDWDVLCLSWGCKNKHDSCTSCGSRVES